ncbi:MAG: hypothetical protein E2O39_04850 [Planctomycetota bacterium]|nr:MAG: hypothetical protein E2O39_04850 [Planctomycetota bacterium]
MRRCRRRAFPWRPHAIDPEVNDSSEPSTLVEFHLEAGTGGSRLTVTESGFDALPEDCRADAFARNEGGWTLQMESIQRHVEG